MSEDFKNSFGVLKSFQIDGQKYSYFSLPELGAQGNTELDRLPFSIRILLENVLRKEDGKLVKENDIMKLASYNPTNVAVEEIPYMPSRVVLQDFTGVPAVVDLAAMRDAMKDLKGEPEKINPIVRSDLVVDHSVQVDIFGTEAAFKFNVAKEYQRNSERYALLKWAQKSFDNFSVVPPGTGIVHQVNLEYLAKVVMTLKNGKDAIAYPDSLVGTDSHTTMINGLSVLGWGVGGIEAEAVMLGQPYYMLMPEVVGVKLHGALPEGSTATDLVLVITQMLREEGVVGKFVEYFGSGLSNLPLPDRATIANMSPEYGATMGFFPIDEVTLNYLRLTARAESRVRLVEEYAKSQNLFRTDETPDPQYKTMLELDLSTVEPSLAGPRRPQDRVLLSAMQPTFKKDLKELFHKDLNDNISKQLNRMEYEGSPAVEKRQSPVPVEIDGDEHLLHHGSIVIAAITSCTNTSNPSVMVAAGLLARKALEKGLLTKPWVKTSLAPGSRVVTEYLEKAGLMDDLEKQRFNLVGYGCTTCIGNSGPLPEEVDEGIRKGDIVAAAVLSGNRNFEGRIHASVRANYLASPPLVVAYALAGRINIDMENEPLGTGKDGQPVYLKDIWPDMEEIKATVREALDPQMFENKYGEVYDGDEHWQELQVEKSAAYDWQQNSTYIKLPPFFTGMSPQKDNISNIKNARVLALLGDSVTTDHISPAGSIPVKSPAGKYLKDHGVEVKDFNTYGSRRGNHEVMMRGTFGNIRIRNQLLHNVEGGYTLYLPTGEQMFIYDAAMKYAEDHTPLIILAGKEYGTGSSRDWAAKGTLLLGVKAVIAQSYERIHRSNLIGMGVLPLQFKEGESWKSLELSGHETFHLTGIAEGLQPGKMLQVTAVNKENQKKEFEVKVRLDTPIEIEYYENGGILQTVIRQMINS
ncbi:MAG: aconitate hydratase AcnA [Calditrichia bacterium]